jgi:hypothetical protein
VPFDFLIIFCSRAVGSENGSHYQWNPIDKPVPVEVQIEVRRHYYAAISWMDELVGSVVSTHLLQPAGCCVKRLSTLKGPGVRLRSDNQLYTNCDFAVKFGAIFIALLSHLRTLLFLNESQLNALDSHGFTGNTIVIFHAGLSSTQKPIKLSGLAPQFQVAGFTKIVDL